jgi:hypothetical protein
MAQPKMEKLSHVLLSLAYVLARLPSDAKPDLTKFFERLSIIQSIIHSHFNFNFNFQHVHLHNNSSTSPTRLRSLERRAKALASPLLNCQLHHPPRNPQPWPNATFQSTVAPSSRPRTPSSPRSCDAVARSSRSRSERPSARRISQREEVSPAAMVLAWALLWEPRPIATMIMFLRRARYVDRKHLHLFSCGYALALRPGGQPHLVFPVQFPLFTFLGGALPSEQLFSLVVDRHHDAPEPAILQVGWGWRYYRNCCENTSPKCIATFVLTCYSN